MPPSLSPVPIQGRLHGRSPRPLAPPREQVETDKLAFLQAAADDEIVPFLSVANVLERVLVLVGPGMHPILPLMAITLK